MVTYHLIQRLQSVSPRTLSRRASLASAVATLRRSQAACPSPFFFSPLVYPERSRRGTRHSPISEHPIRMRVLSKRTESKDLSYSANSFLCHRSEKSARNPFICHTSKNAPSQVLCLPHLRHPPASGCRRQRPFPFSLFQFPSPLFRWAVLLAVPGRFSSFVFRASSLPPIWRLFFSPC